MDVARFRDSPEAEVPIVGSLLNLLQDDDSSLRAEAASISATILESDAASASKNDVLRAEAPRLGLTSAACFAALYSYMSRQAASQAAWGAYLWNIVLPSAFEISEYTRYSLQLGRHELTAPPSADDTVSRAFPEHDRVFVAERPNLHKDRVAEVRKAAEALLPLLANGAFVVPSVDVQRLERLASTTESLLSQDRSRRDADLHLLLAHVAAGIASLVHSGEASKATATSIMESNRRVQQAASPLAMGVALTRSSFGEEPGTEMKPTTTTATGKTDRPLCIA